VRMFSYHIMRYGARQVVAEHGYRSVLASFRRHLPDYEQRLERHGIHVAASPHDLPDTPAPLPYHSPVARALAGSLDRLGTKLRSAGIA